MSTNFEAEVRTPDGRPAGTVHVNPDAVSNLGTKHDRKTGCDFLLRNEHGKIITKWCN